MKKSTVAAGCIAGVVAACSGAGLEAIGDTMHDAGHAMAGVGGSLEAAGHGMNAGVGELVAGAGRVMAGAGSSVEAAGSALVAGGSAGASGAQAQEAVADELPRPRWVLRDKDGAPAQVDVSPLYNEKTPRFGTEPDCVRVNYAGQRRIDLSYDLSTGKLALRSTCDSGALVNPGYTSIKQLGTYATPDCSGIAYINGANLLIWLTDQVYYSYPAPIDLTMTSSWNPETSTCESVSASRAETLYPLQAVPDDVANLLPNPPYTLELVY
jgi:hypothetical protein